MNPLWISLLLALCQLLMAALSYFTSKRNGAQLHKLELTVDGRLTELLARTGDAAFLRGEKAGAEAQPK